MFAQTISGDLTGSVFDASGAIRSLTPRSRRRTKRPASNPPRNPLTTTGEYRLSNLPAGSYTVTISATGFGQTQTKGIQVAINQSQTANFTLQVGTTTSDRGSQGIVGHYRYHHSASAEYF